MNPLRKCIAPFLCAFVACPVFILLHELGHYAAGASLGVSVKLHYAEVSGIIAKKKLTWQSSVLLTAAGPFVNAALAAVGFLWLHRLRRQRREAEPTLRDWLATTLVLNAGRWLRGFTGPPSHAQPKDESLVSQAIGLPAWFLPYLLALLAVIAVIATLRLHPPGGRFLPFLSMGLGGVTGVFLWMNVVGPYLLPLKIAL